MSSEIKWTIENPCLTYLLMSVLGTAKWFDQGGSAPWAIGHLYRCSAGDQSGGAAAQWIFTICWSLYFQSWMIGHLCVFCTIILLIYFAFIVCMYPCGQVVYLLFLTPFGILLGVIVSSYQWCTECGIASHDALTGKNLSWVISSYLLVQGVKLDGFWPVCRAFPGPGGCGRDGRRGIGKSFGVAPQHKDQLGIQSCEACEACKARERTAVEEVRIQTLPFLRHTAHSCAPRWTWRRCLWHWRPQPGEFWSSGQVVKGRTGGSDSRDHCRPTERVNMDLHGLYNDDWRYQDWNSL